MKANRDELYQTFYFAYYKKCSGIPLAVSVCRDLVVEYMERHRRVSPNEYYIKDLEFTPGEIVFDYDNIVLNQYGDWYLPNIDIEMLSLNKLDLEEDVNETLEGLKNILLLVKDIKKVPETDKECILKTFQIILGLKKKKKIWNKMVDEYRLTSLIFMDIEEYLPKRTMYIEMKEARERWNYMITEKDET